MMEWIDPADNSRVLVNTNQIAIIEWEPGSAEVKITFSGGAEITLIETDSEDALALYERLEEYVDGNLE